MNVRRITAILILAAGASVWLWRSERRPPARYFADALATLERGEAEGLDRAFRVLETEPGFEGHLRVLEAALALKLGQPNKALEKLARVQPVGELRRPALFYVAQALYQQKRLVEAENLLRTITSERPDDAEAFRWLGIVNYDLGASESARAALLRLSELVPDDFRPHRLMGLMHRDFLQHAEAVPEYERALERSPPSEVRNEILLELADCLIAIRKYDEAIARLEQAPLSAKTQALLARCLLNQGQNDDAKSRLEAARTLSPDDRDVLFMEAEIHSVENRRADAVAALRRAVELYPHDLECLYRFGLLLQQQGNEEESKEVLARWKTFNDLTMRLSELNLQAVSEPHNAEVRLQLAEVCEQLNKPELARVWRDAAAACTSASPAPSQLPL